MSLSLLLTSLTPLISKVIDKAIPDKDAAEKAKNEISAELISHAAEMEKAGADIVLAEAQSSKSLTSQWRPILMLTITVIIANNYILAPYLAAMFDWSVTLEIPDKLWNLLNIGVGGYVIGRSGEKITRTLAASKK